MDVRAGEHVGVAFRRGHKKCVFTSVVLERQEYDRNSDAPVPALTLSWPESMQELQRRAMAAFEVAR